MKCKSPRAASKQTKKIKIKQKENTQQTHNTQWKSKWEVRKISGKYRGRQGVGSRGIMRHLIMTPASLSASTPTLSTLHHQRMALQSQSSSQSPLTSASQSPLTPSPSSFFGSPKFPANYERSEKVSAKNKQTSNSWKPKFTVKANKNVDEAGEYSYYAFKV